MIRKLVALGAVAAAVAAAALPATAQCCGFWGFPYWAPWGSGWGCWGYGWSGIHLFPWGGCCW